MPDDVTKPDGKVDEPVKTNAATETVPPATVSAPPASPDTDWQKAYKGLQSNYDKRVAEIANLQAEVDTLNATIESQKQELRQATTEKDQIATKHVEATETISNLESKANVAEQQNQRYKLIMSEFNDLAQFEAKGLLPQAQNEEEMRSKFGEFRETLGETVQASTDEKLKGIGPGSTEPKEPEPDNPDQIYNRMSALAGTKDPEERREYEILSRKWLEIQENE